MCALGRRLIDGSIININDIRKDHLVSASIVLCSILSFSCCQTFSSLALCWHRSSNNSICNAYYTQNEMFLPSMEILLGINWWKFRVLSVDDTFSSSLTEDSLSVEGKKKCTKWGEASNERGNLNELRGGSQLEAACWDSTAHARLNFWALE